MNHFRSYVRIALILAVLATPTTGLLAQAPPVEAGGGDVWLDSLAEARAEAKERGRPLVVLITAPGWCEPCDRFEETALRDTGVVDLLRDSFVAVRLTDRNPEHADFDFPGYPSLLVFHPTGGRLAAQGGLRTARDVRSVLDPFEGPLESLPPPTETADRMSTAEKVYDFSNGSVVSEGDDAYTLRTGSEQRPFTAYRRDEGYVYLSADTGREFIALPTDGGQAFRWNPEAETWDPAWKVSVSEPAE